jgi:chromosome segregation ATPase
VTRTLDLLHELAGADEAHRATQATLDELAARAAALRARAEWASGVLAAAPSERERLAREVAEAEARFEERAAALAAAEAELAEAEGRRDRELLLAARRFEVRARDTLAVAAKHVAAAREALSDHERQVAGAEHDIPQVEAEAAELARELGAAPWVPAQATQSPGPGLAGVLAWATGVRAALVVARSGVTSERETLTRQANEIASLVLGEPQAAMSAALAAQRVERSLGS